MFRKLIRTTTIVSIVGGTLVLSGCVGSLNFNRALDSISVQDNQARPVYVAAIVRPESLHHVGRSLEQQGGLELTYERYIGDGTDVVGNAQYLSLDGQVISGPQTVQTRETIYHAQIGYAQAFNFSRHFQLEPSLAFGYDTQTMSAWVAEPGGAHIERSQHDWNVNVSVAPRWKFNRYLAIQVRLRGGVSNDGSVSGVRYPAIVITPVSSVELYLGYLWFDRVTETPTSTSNVDTKEEGPLASLRLVF